MIRLIRVQAEENMNRFYTVHVVPDLFGQWSVVREWGRIGQPGQVRVNAALDQPDAMAQADQIVAFRIRRGYQIEHGQFLHGTPNASARTIGREAD